ncbi:MAG: hypothetical protein QE267_01745 [Akkermansiaceae bacterium]|nr:hypothetical protein [Akkermansiaceae bacterium]
MHSVDDHASLPAVVAEGVFPLTLLGLDSEPLLRHLGCGQLPVVLEDDGGRVDCLQRHLIGTLDDGDPVTDEWAGSVHVILNQEAVTQLTYITTRNKAETGTATLAITGPIDTPS